MDVDFEQKNAIGGLDRLVTNIAMAAIAVFPTLGAGLATPWRLVPLLTSDEPDGHRGMLLSPGAFLPLGLTVVLLVAALFTSSETEASNQAVIGPTLALSVANAAGEGDIWRTVSLIAPIYASAVAIALFAQVLRPFIGTWWGLRTSIRAAFYQVGITICWILLTSVIIDTYRVQSGDFDFGTLLYSLNSIPILAITPWLYFWFFRSVDSVGTFKAIGLALAMGVLSVGLLTGTIWMVGQV